MRKALAKLCHGGERHPREPLGVAAPFARAVAWCVAVLTCLTVLVLSAAYVVAPGAWAVTAIVVVGMLGVTITSGARYIAGSVRPAPLGLRLTRRRS